jgi:hypothetical protein
MVHPLKAENAPLATGAKPTSSGSARSKAGSPSSKDYWRYLNYYSSDKDFSAPKVAITTYQPNIK